MVGIVIVSTFIYSSSLKPLKPSSSDGKNINSECTNQLSLVKVRELLKIHRHEDLGTNAGVWVFSTAVNNDLQGPGCLLVLLGDDSLAMPICRPDPCISKKEWSQVPAAFGSWFFRCHLVSGPGLAMDCLDKTLQIPAMAPHHLLQYCCSGKVSQKSLLTGSNYHTHCGCK